MALARTIAGDRLLNRTMTPSARLDDAEADVAGLRWDVVTDVVQPDAAGIQRAAEVLRAGGLVAFPTETVYGLGAHALDREAVRRLFAAKGRPANDPLIVHVATLDEADHLIASRPGSVAALAARFWPGPLTLVLPRSALVPDEVTAGLASVAIRVPAHPVALALITAVGVPVAAPSANLFSRPSPTRASHVLADLDGRIDLVVDGGATTVGVESTVLDLTQDIPTVLRPGAVTLEMLGGVLPLVRMRDASHAASGAEPMVSPGLLSRHYSPRAPLTLYEGHAAPVVARLGADAREASYRGLHVGILAADDDAVDGFTIVRVGSDRDLPGVAARLYAALREIDAAGTDVILARGFPADTGIGVAIQDRLRRAAAGRIVHVDS
jgi:L-threonylcarbamoyladenylate synthase